MALSSYSLYYYTQGPTPTQWAGLAAQGPAGAALSCYPSPTRTVTDAFEWIATGNGCPIGYGLSSSLYGTIATCLWTGDFTPTQTFTFECIFTVHTDAVTTVDGGTTTVAKGNAVTVTADTKTITVTQTMQQTSTATSIVAPGAATVSVTSTVTQNGALAKKNDPQVAESEGKQMPVLGDKSFGTDVGYSYANSSDPLDKRACTVQCLDYCCDGRTCIGDGYHCCSTFYCVPYDPAAVFADSGASYLQWVSHLDTSTIVNYQTSTTYETVTIASGTITVTPTSTQSVIVTNIQTVSVTVTTQVGTVTVTVFTTVIVGSFSTTGVTTPTAGVTTPTPNIITSIRVTTVSFTSGIGSLTHSPIPSWPGSGKLLVGYCTTPDYVLLTGPTTYWAPFIGCDQNKPDCCPFPVVTAAENYPVPQFTSQATLSHCPDDYQTVSNGCCPSGYSLWATALGGQTPCFSALQTLLSPPGIPSALITAIDHAAAAASQTPIQAIENVVYAMAYPVNSPPSGLSTAAQAGIGAGAGVVGLALLAVGIFFLMRGRRGERRPESDPSPKSDPAHYSGSTFASPGPASPVPPNMQQAPTVPYIETQYEGIEHYSYPYANNNPAMPIRGYSAPENATAPPQGGYSPQGGYPPQEMSSTVPLGGYLPTENPEHGPRPAYQSWPPIRDQHWQTAQGLQVSPPTSTASPPPDSQHGDRYSSQGSQTGLRPSELHASHGWTGERPELQGGQQQERWELGGREGVS